MPVVTRRQLSSFYGALEAREFLYKERRKEIALDIADRYLEFAGDITRAQFLYVVRSLGPDLLKSLKHKMPPSSYRALIRYAHRCTQRLPVRRPRCVSMDNILNVYDDVMLLYERSKEFMPEPGDMMRKLIAIGYAHLREAHKRKSAASIACAADFINGLHHSEGQLVIWLDEDCDKGYAAYTLTLASASVYQPEMLAYMYRDIRVALRMKARFYTAEGVFDPYNRQQFLDNFVKRSDLFDEGTFEVMRAQIDSPRLLRELSRETVYIKILERHANAYGENPWNKT